MNIHPTAIVHPKARIAEGVEIGPYSVIGEHVSIGKDTKIASHVLIEGWTTIGERNQIHSFSSIGTPPQDIGYRNEETYLDHRQRQRHPGMRDRASGDDQGRPENGDREQELPDGLFPRGP